MNTIHTAPLSDIADILRNLADLLAPAPVKTAKPAKPKGRPPNPRSLRQRALAQFAKGRSRKQVLHSLSPHGLTVGASHRYWAEHRKRG